MYGYRRNTVRRSMSAISLNAAEEAEVEELVELFRGMGFTQSAQISNYIRRNRLGFRFPNISGYLSLSSEDGLDSWDFEGGIKPFYYREICRRLDLHNKRSRAQVIGFKSFSESGNYW